LIGNASRALDGARDAAAAIGFEPRRVTRRLSGEAAAVGATIGRRLRKSPRPACWLLAGETTVHVDRAGNGGRNQELALAAAIAIQGARNVVVMTLATDGIDGPTDAAGAIVTGDTYAALLGANIDPLAALTRHDSHSVLDRVGALIRTGPTGTNVGDVVVCLAYPGDATS
jgi:hydroxypyruvate reductase